MWEAILLRNWKVIAAVAGIATVLFATWSAGANHVQKKWDLEIERQKVIAELAQKLDKEARDAIEKQHQKDIEIVRSEAGKSAIRDYLRTHGLLHSNSNQAQSTAKLNDTSPESGTSASIEAFGAACALDALQVLRWQEWAIREGLEVVE